MRISEANEAKYFLKLAPSISIIDLAEKYFFDKNIDQNTIQNVFFFLKKQSEPDNRTLNFSRILFRGKVEDIPDSFLYEFKSNGDDYGILISEDSETLNIKILSEEIIGVGF